MPEISQAELDDLRAKAAKADHPAEPGPADQPEEAPERVRVKGVDAKAGFDDDEPPAADQRAILANGDTHDFSGAQPTHVAVGGISVPVLSTFPIRDLEEPAKAGKTGKAAPAKPVKK